jgi:hypothetical protein
VSVLPKKSNFPTNLKNQVRKDSVRSKQTSSELKFERDRIQKQLDEASEGDLEERSDLAFSNM